MRGGIAWGLWGMFYDELARRGRAFGEAEEKKCMHGVRCQELAHTIPLRSREFGVLFGLLKMYIDGHGAWIPNSVLDKRSR